VCLPSQEGQTATRGGCWALDSHSERFGSKSISPSGIVFVLAAVDKQIPASPHLPTSPNRHCKLRPSFLLYAYSTIFGRSGAAADVLASGSWGFSTENDDDEDTSMLALSSYSASPGGGFPTGHCFIQSKINRERYEREQKRKVKVVIVILSVDYNSEEILTWKKRGTQRRRKKSVKK